MHIKFTNLKKNPVR